MIIAIGKIIFTLISFNYIFYSNKKFTDSGLTNFGKSFENCPALNSISLNFFR